MTILSNKIDNLGDTLDLVVRNDLTDFTKFFRDGLARSAVAVGSGGSVASALFFAACRETRGAPATTIRTPLEFVADNSSLAGIPVWLFSARGENPDIEAALSAAAQRMAAEIFFVTSNAGSSLLQRFPAILRPLVLPVSDPKDGFLSTHSLVSGVGSILLASIPAPYPHYRDLISALRETLATKIAPAYRDAMRGTLTDIGMTRNASVLILHDPRLTAAAVTLETSIWEAALGSVQRVDFRNFAHGRHTWLARNLSSTTVVALTGHMTSSVWEDIRRRLPKELRSITLDYGNCGRLSGAAAIWDALVVLEAMGHIFGIDPGKPGVGEFAKAVYDAPSLIEVEKRLSPGARKKLAAVLDYDLPTMPQPDVVIAHSEATDALRLSRFGALVLDYDGTLVPTDRREYPPSAGIVEKLTELLDQGMRIAFATGRGGSGCRALRSTIPARHHENVLVGYYNGGWIQPLSVDIEVYPAEPDPALEPVIAWLNARTRHFLRAKRFDPARQLTIRFSELESSATFMGELEAAPFTEDGSVRVVTSGHSVDIIPAASSKTNVVRRVQAAIGADLSVLCIGDSGDIGGNDFELLGYRHGVSVGRVCHRPDCCWPLFGERVTGPEALVAILKGLRRSSHGVFSLKLDVLE